MGNADERVWTLRYVLFGAFDVVLWLMEHSFQWSGWRLYDDMDTECTVHKG